MIYSIYSTQPTPFNATATPITTPTFACPINSTQCSFVCIARGWPAPSLHWVNQDGQETTTFIVRESGVVTANLNWNRTQSQYRCEARNVYGSSSQSVNLVTVETSLPTIPIPTAPDDTTIKLRLRLLTPDCGDQSNPSVRQEELQVSLLQVVLSQCQSCTTDTLSLTVTTSGCDKDSTIFIVSLSGSSLSRLYQTLAEWWSSAPSIGLSKALYNVDISCGFIVYDTINQLVCESQTSSSSRVSPSSSSTPTATPTGNAFEVLWGVVVGVIAILCLVVGGTLCVVLCLCVRSCRNQKGEGVAS